MNEGNSRKRQIPLPTCLTISPKKSRRSETLGGKFELVSTTLGESTQSEASASCVSEIRGHEQAQPPDKTCAWIPSACQKPAFFSQLRTEFPLVEEELLLYSLTVTAFPHKGFNLKLKSKEKYYPIVNAIDSVYHVQFDINDLRNYFYRVTNNLVKGRGIVNGTVRWMYYKESVVEVLNGFKPVLEELLIDSNSVERDRVENLRSVLSKECSKLVESSNGASADVTVVSQDTRSGSEMLDLENIEQVSILQKFLRWKVNYNAIRKLGYLFFFSGNDGYAEVEIIINSDQSWYIVLDGKKRDNAKILGEWADIPDVITLVSELQLLMSTVENCRICRGCPY